MAPFDPYHIWLEIPPDEQPPTPHRLLGIAPDETDKETIREAALQRNAFIRQFSLGEQGKIAERLLNEIAAARDNILAGKVQTAVETPLAVETPIEPDVEKVDPAAATLVSPIPVVVREPVTQEFPVSVVQSAKRTRRTKPKEIWKQPVVIGVSLVGVIGVLVLFISLMSSGDAEPVASNTADQNSVDMAAEKAAADKAAADKAAADKVALLARAPITNTIGMKLKLIPAGTFTMGSPEDEPDRGNEHQHNVTITKAFYMQTTEVTQGHWKSVMGTEPWKGERQSRFSQVKEGANYAATWVSWDDAVAFCNQLSEKEGKTYRLPTEAEWEYACRSGTQTTWSFGNDKKELGDYDWYQENASNIGEKHAHQVGLKKPNAFGLYDMHGNVWEWCSDYYEEDYYKQSPKQDPQGPDPAKPYGYISNGRVMRGGAWSNNTPFTRSADRSSLLSGKSCLGGFRLVRELDDSTQSTPPPLTTPPVPVDPPVIDQPDPPVIDLPSITNTIGMTLNKIPAGTFTMGSPEDEPDRGNEHQHKVTISKAFYMQTTEVTQGQWKAVMGTEPWKGKSFVKEGPNYAASYVSWDDAIAYCKKLSEAEDKTYRLPTEAEWEYACRAKTETRWSFGDDENKLGDYAWNYDNANSAGEKYAHHVGLKKPNPFGLYDMHGNVWEWCHDYYGEDYYQQSPINDPQGPESGSSPDGRVLRGGSYVFLWRLARSAYRYRNHILDTDSSDVGFRLVRELDDSTQSPPPPVPPTAPAIESITNTIGMTLNKIPAGTFTMGSPEDEPDRGNEHQHKVTITKPFYIQTTEVTQGQWKEVMGTEPWKGKVYVKEGPNNAASFVSWNDAVAYCKKLSEKEGKTYRLPTEAEWEYACRAKTETTWSFGDDEKELGDYAWHRENAWDIDEKYAHHVGRKKPNEFGLYDMHGNVWEWCHDYYGKDFYQQSPGKDPTGPASGSSRVLRGGSWVCITAISYSRSADRFWIVADRRLHDFGFRLVRELDDSTQSPPPPVPPTAPATESTTNTIGMTLNKIPAGTFTMGSPEGEPDRENNEQQHPVTISKAFYMQTTEVTQGQWKAVMATEPWKGKSLVKEGANYAASYVSWNDAVAYCEKLSEKESVTYRLPTEAEWEYACRAETKTTWSFGDDEASLGDYAWHDKNAYYIGEKYAHQVGLKKPNAFGLYDMHGNVYEWCHDYYEEDYYKQSPAQDPPGPTSGSFRVFRGGSWSYDSRNSRSANRNRDGADSRLNRYGFRLVRELDDSEQSPPPPVPPTAPATESTTNTIGMKLNKIPAGTFMMGSPEGEEGRRDNETQHPVTISKPFYMQTTEVTQGQWKEVMGTEPWKGKQYVKEGPNYAATWVSWNDAVAYCKKLSEKEGKTYRLPTEAEWEYACRAGTETRWSFGDDEKELGDYAWYRDNAYDIDEKYAHQVELKKPNAFGLYDMHGNVYEWCHDYYEEDYYKQSPAQDPPGPTSGSSRVLRGGSWVNYSRHSRSARRDRLVADRYDGRYGFRLVRELD